MNKIIAVDCREFQRGKITGIGRFLRNFISYAARARGGWRFILLGGPETEIPAGLGPNVGAAVIDHRDARLWEQAGLPALLKRERCGLFFSPYYKTCLFTSVPSVVTIHDLTSLIYPGYCSFPFFYRRLMRLYAGKAAAVMTDSLNSKKDIERILGIDPDKISVVNGSVDRSFFYERMDTAAVKSRYGIPGRYILCVGNSNPHKNLDGLVKAYAGLPEGIKKEYSLVLAGAGQDALFPEHRTDASCIVCGHVADEDLPALYSGASLFVFPSFYEGFGLPPLEAMACGCPVASSSAACMPEILGDACVYFDPSDTGAMRRVMLGALKDAGLAAVLKMKGSARAALYTPDKICTGALEVLESALGGHSKAE